MAKRRSAPNFILLVLLVIGAGTIALRFLSDDGFPVQDTSPASAVTNTVPETLSAPANRSEEPSENVSDSSGPIRIFFSNAYENNPSIGENDTENIDRQLVRFINASRENLDCALFELESERIAQALIDAHRRGVRVRIVCESDYAGNPDMLALQEAHIPIVPDHRSGFMHNKFLVADGERVWTGSFNATDNGAFRNNNNAVILHSAELSENYEMEFEEMFQQKAFGPRSPSSTPHTFVKLPNADISNYFSPEDDPDEKILRYLKLARKRIRFLAFSMTDDRIGRILAEKHREGVDVQGVLESRGSGLQYSELGRLRKAGVPVLTDGNKYILHHKVMIIDDKWTILGSYNFSKSAAETNDENILIIKSERVAGVFQQEYLRIRHMAEQNL